MSHLDLAPLRALTDSPADMDYLVKLIKMLIMSDGRGEILPDEDERLGRAIARQMQLPPEMRELAGVAVALGQSSENGARARLRKWCWGQRLGWAVDCRADLLDTTRQVSSAMTRQRFSRTLRLLARSCHTSSIARAN